MNLLSNSPKKRLKQLVQDVNVTGGSIFLDDGWTRKFLESGGGTGIGDFVLLLSRGTFFL